ncbi:MAG: 50S ribosomal protein L18 [bacterium]|nr:50S ribosomal protein L18 [bacterium]
MDINKIKQAKRFRRKGRVRAKVSGTAVCPRLTVFRSNRGIYAQIINDEIGRTLVSVGAGEAHPVKSGSAGPDSNREFNGVKAKGLPTGQIGKKTAISLELGKLIAEKAVAKGISRVVFDRNGYKYHGRVKALAEGARLGGLKF